MPYSEIWFQLSSLIIVDDEKVSGLLEKRRSLQWDKCGYCPGTVDLKIIISMEDSSWFWLGVVKYLSWGYIYLLV